jgi:hypothetical protein
MIIRRNRLIHKKMGMYKAKAPGNSLAAIQLKDVDQLLGQPIAAMSHKVNPRCAANQSLSGEPIMVMQLNKTFATGDIAASRLCRGILCHFMTGLGNTVKASSGTLT